MSAKPVIAIFDVGKTNKKLFLFDEQYRMVYEKAARFIETVDEDGEACENLESLELSIKDSMHELFSLKDFDVRAVNFTTYGASMVYIDAAGKPLTPLYNYLKAYPKPLQQALYDKYGGAGRMALETASPTLGSLNSGMQIYRLKNERPTVFRRTRYALHLPQYLSYLLTGAVCSDITSIGCHTQLWDFHEHDYHHWVKGEGIGKKLAPLAETSLVLSPAAPRSDYHVGIGLHDSSAALIPYLVNFHEPFVMISTGTWCITLNPFNNIPLTAEELAEDCLCYLSYKGRPVKASRLFTGHEHEEQVKRIAAHFHQSPVGFRTMPYRAELVRRLLKRPPPDDVLMDRSIKESPFRYRDLNAFSSDAEAYHQLMIDLVSMQYKSTDLVMKGTDARRILVDGGFSHNAIYMNLLARVFPDCEVYAASMAQATAIGAALAIHPSWNESPVPSDIIALKYYAAKQGLKL